jgi:ribosomal protein S18 acetylase RimI-like enzyme
MTVAIPARLAPFPAERPGRTDIPASLVGRGFSLRALRDDDLPWLRDLYASTRAEEMAQVPWPDAAKRGFLDQQFELQHRHFLAYYGDADFLAIEHRDTGVCGRYYLQRTPPTHLLVDICLFPRVRSQGVGAILIQHSQQAASAAGCAMELHVLRTNLGARRLYERLGFAEVGVSAETHLKMRWPSVPI